MGRSEFRLGAIAWSDVLEIEKLPPVFAQCRGQPQGREPAAGVVFPWIVVRKIRVTLHAVRGLDHENDIRLLILEKQQRIELRERGRCQYE